MMIEEREKTINHSWTASFKTKASIWCMTERPSKLNRRYCVNQQSNWSNKCCSKSLPRPLSLAGTIIFYCLMATLYATSLYAVTRWLNKEQKSSDTKLFQFFVFFLNAVLQSFTYEYILCIHSIIRFEFPKRNGQTSRSRSGIISARKEIAHSLCIIKYIQLIFFLKLIQIFMM